ncbi:hypothetical protein RHO15_08885 [Utexia brackfieldae]|uniref:hypothetical protein n=1 Tax=Utexia brackfieldae TaxID=3074108 RepID=UPI00370DCB9D
MKIMISMNNRQEDDLVEISDKFSFILKDDDYEEMNKKLTQALCISTMLICDGDRYDFELEYHIIVSAIETVHDLMCDVRKTLMSCHIA